MNHDQYIKSIEDNILDTTRKLIEGDINLVEGVRILRDCSSKLGIQDDEKLMVLKAVDSDTDDYPCGAVRKNWNKESLEKMDTEISDYLEEVRPQVVECCKYLQIKYDGKSDV